MRVQLARPKALVPLPEPLEHRDRRELVALFLAEGGTGNPGRADQACAARGAQHREGSRGAQE